MKNLYIIGAGPAGLMAAISAARTSDEVKITILEGNERPGKKLLTTGNGRCNLTNMDPELPLHYYGSAAMPARKLLSEKGALWVRSFFKELGLLTIEKNGYVYPYTMQARSVLDVLLNEAERLKIRIKTGEKIIKLVKSDGYVEKFHIYTDSWIYQADAVIIACGSKAAPASGSDGSGYELAEQAGHQLAPVAPALTAMTSSFNEASQLAGLRSSARVTLYGKRKKEDSFDLIASEQGELQWTKNGISGIVVFQLSRFIEYPASYEAEINLFPSFEEDELCKLLLKRKESCPKMSAARLFSGILQEKIIPVLMKRAAIGKNINCSQLKAEQIKALLHEAFHFRIPITGTLSFKEAQVCRGGVLAGDLNPRTLESRILPGLYFAGEVIDIDGPCGGYNLQWAWTSGYISGQSAAFRLS